MLAVDSLLVLTVSMVGSLLALRVESLLRVGSLLMVDSLLGLRVPMEDSLVAVDSLLVQRVQARS